MQIDLYLLNGSNEGDRELQLQTALTLLEEHFGKVTNASKLYETQAWGKEDQQSFYNQALHFQTDLQAEEALNICQQVEHQLGRERHEKWGSRIIDIDILFYGNQIIKSDRLTVPHRLLHLRNFALVPLEEIAADFIHPQFEINISDLLKNSTDQLKVVKLSDK